MRIAFFSDNFYPELSGIVDSIIITGKELRKRGHDIAYVGPYYAPNDYTLAKRKFPPTLKEDTIDGMPVARLGSVHLPASPTGQSRFSLPLGASFDFLDTFKPDIIHTQSPYGTGWEAVRAAKRFKVPLLGTNHTAIEDFVPVASVMRRYDAWYYNHCAFVTAPYANLLSRMREVGFTREGAAQANPAALEHFSLPSESEKTEIKKELNLNGPVLLYTGRLAVEKRVDVVLRGIAKLVTNFPTITLLATGHGADEPRLRALAKKLGIEKNVRFLGFISLTDLSKYYKATDVFTFMSTSDSQSIALMQAYATGVPGVCARARGLPDYTPADCGFLVEPGDDAALAEKVKILLSDGALRARMGAAGIEFVKKFSPSHIAGDWEEIYKRFMKRG